MKKGYDVMILDAIFEGRIYPAENIVPKNHAFQESAKAVEGIMKYLEKNLTKEEYEKITELNDRILDGQILLGKELYKAGFATGVLLMKEIYDYPVLPSTD